MIRVGIGGWTYEPWRGSFYPAGLRQADEQAYATSKLTAIEINGTFYSSFKPETWAKWEAVAPEGFQYAMKASRFCTNRKVLGDAGESVERFVGQGLTVLGAKLGPLLWQLAATKKYDREDIARFFALLPAERDGLRLRHVIEPRHESFLTPDFIELAREHNVAIVFADGKDRPVIADPTADFVYARLQGCEEENEAGYPPEEIARWAAIARAWEAGESPAGLPYVAESSGSAPRDVFLFFISGAKVRAPQAAQAVIEQLKRA